ncbi:MAG: hypothetical protein ACYC4A_10325 [Desulfobulbia bacterium]
MASVASGAHMTFFLFYQADDLEATVIPCRSRFLKIGDAAACPGVSFCHQKLVTKSSGRRDLVVTKKGKAAPCGRLFNTAVAPCTADYLKYSTEKRRSNSGKVTLTPSHPA